MALRSEYNAYKNITLAAPTTTLVKTGPGMLDKLTFNKPAATGVTTIYDGVDATGTLIGAVTSGDAIAKTLHYGVKFATGLCIVTSVAAQDITVVYG